MKISVIIPSHNRPQKLADTLHSLKHQDMDKAEYEIIVVDDGSFPAVSIPHEDSLPMYLIRLAGVGRSLARNTGAREAHGELLIFLDDDILISADFLAAHTLAYEEWPDALLIGAIRLPVKDPSKPFVRFRQSLENHGVPPQRGIVVARNFCAAANMAISRERFLKLGGFDPSIHSSEDQDFALRHTAAGGRIAYVPEAESIHCDDALDIRTYCRRAEWGMREMIPFCRRYPDWPDNVERARINGYIQFRREPFLLSLRKMFKLTMGLPSLVWLLFAWVSFMERVAPQSGMLDRLYRLLLGIFIFRGYRGGLKKHGTTLMSGQDIDAQLHTERTAL